MSDALSLSYSVDRLYTSRRLLRHATFIKHFNHNCLIVYFDQTKVNRFLWSRRIYLRWTRCFKVRHPGEKPVSALLRARSSETPFNPCLPLSASSAPGKQGNGMWMELLPRKVFRWGGGKDIQFSRKHMLIPVRK